MSQAVLVTSGNTFVLMPDTWNVDDQGNRGACVAFAMAAHCEFLDSSPPPPSPKLSEQYLFWGAKQKDNLPDEDGTRLCYAEAALNDFGICEHRYWPYVGTAIPNNVSHADGTKPDSFAHRNARTRLRLSTHSTVEGSLAGGNAQRLLQALKTRNCPIPISVPVFEDSQSDSHGKLDNWNNALAVLSGKVLAPPPSARVVGGHAVCVVGFMENPSEPLGGYFVFRNSWGNTWARSADQYSGGLLAPGYGYLGAAYVDEFLWEMFI